MQLPYSHQIHISTHTSHCFPLSLSFFLKPPYTHVYTCKMQQTCWGVSSMQQRLVSEVIVSPFVEFWLAFAFSLLSLKMPWTQEFLSSESPSSRLIPQIRDLCSGSHWSRVPREVHEALNLITSAGSSLLTLVFASSYFLRAFLRVHPCKSLLQTIMVFFRIYWGRIKPTRGSEDFPMSYFFLRFGVWGLSSEIVFFVFILFCRTEVYRMYPKKQWDWFFS